MNVTAYKQLGDGDLVCPVSRISGDYPVEDLLGWLIFSSSTITPSGIKVAWNLGRFVKAVLSRLPESVITELTRSPHRARFGNYKLFYIPDKVFSVNKNGSEASFYDLSQYFPGDSEPLCVTLLQAKADQLGSALQGLGINRPQSLSSPLACFKNHSALDGLEDEVVTAFDVPDGLLSAHEIALECTPREWISNYQIGHFPALWKYDISSAYPFHASELFDLRDCAVYEAEDADVLADDGFLVGDFTVYPDHPLAFCSPFLTDRGDGVQINFVETEKDYACTLSDVRHLHAWRMGEFHFKKGWLMRSIVEEPRRPFAEVMSTLYSLRDGTEPRSYIVKRVMNGIIGRLLETRKDSRGNVLEYGSLFNPIYHALITAGTRLRIFDFIAGHELTANELVSVAVDEVRTSRWLPVPTRRGMGDWCRSETGSAFILSPGAIITPGRDFKRTDYASLLTQCVEHPKAALLGNDPADPIDVRRLFLNQTRGFDKLPRNGGELLATTYPSRPVEPNSSTM